MSRWGFVLLSFLFVSMALAKDAASQELSVNIACPVSVAAGEALKVTAVVQNRDCVDDYSVVRGMAMLLGNEGGTLAGLGIWGPYQKVFSPWNVPKATCDEYDNVITPGTSTPKVVLVTTIPAAGNLANKMATVVFTVITGNGRTLAAGTCVVNVKP